MKVRNCLGCREGCATPAGPARYARFHPRWSHDKTRLHGDTGIPDGHSGLGVPWSLVSSLGCRRRVITLVDWINNIVACVLKIRPPYISASLPSYPQHQRGDVPTEERREVGGAYLSA